MATGGNHNALLTSVVEGLVTIEASISDDAYYAGVYRVNINVPKDAAQGEYSVAVELLGFQIPISNIFVVACTNFEALERGLIESVWQTNILEEHYYEVSRDPLTIELEPVETYCGQEPTTLLISATANWIDGFTSKDLDLEELAEHGITLNAKKDGTQYVYVSSEDRSLINWSFDLILSSTVQEETSWSNT